MNISGSEHAKDVLSSSDDDSDISDDDFDCYDDGDAQGRDALMF